MRYIVATESLISITGSSRRKTILKTEQDLNVKTNYLCVETYNRKKTASQNYMRYIVGTEFLLSVTRSSRRKTILKTE